MTKTTGLRTDPHQRLKATAKILQPQSLPAVFSVADEDDTMPQDNETSNILDEFDVDSGSEKELLLYCLTNDCPEEDIKELEKACRAPNPDRGIGQEERNEDAELLRNLDLDWQEFSFLDDTSRSGEIKAKAYKGQMDQKDESNKAPLPDLLLPTPYMVLQKSVEAFAQSHAFHSQSTATTLQRRQFTRDIYDFARALGMPKHQADVEVARGRAAYRRQHGIPGGLQLDETDDESNLGLEIDDAVDYIRSLKSGMVPGLADSVGAQKELANLQSKSLCLSPPSKKRKLEEAADGELTARLGLDTDAKRARKKAKKERIRQSKTEQTISPDENLATSLRLALDTKAARKKAKRDVMRERKLQRKSEGIQSDSVLKPKLEPLEIDPTSAIEANPLAGIVSNPKKRKTKNHKKSASRRRKQVIDSILGLDPPPFVDSRKRKKRKRSRKAGLSFPEHAGGNGSGSMGYKPSEDPRLEKTDVPESTKLSYTIDESTKEFVEKLQEINVDHEPLVLGQEKPAVITIDTKKTKKGQNNNAQGIAEEGKKHGEGTLEEQKLEVMDVVEASIPWSETQSVKEQRPQSARRDRGRGNKNSVALKESHS